MTYLLLILGLNLGIYSSSQSQEVVIDLKVFLEGPYDEITGQMSTKLYDLGYLPGMKPKTFFAKAVDFYDPYHHIGTDNQKVVLRPLASYPDGSVDWVYVKIEETKTKKDIYSGTVLLLQDGTISMDNLDDERLTDQQSYVVTLIHRNHLPVRSPAIKMDNGVLAYDFTSSSDQLDLKTIGKVKAMFAGNIYQDASKKSGTTIDQGDMDLWHSVNGQNSTYLIEDVDLNGDVSVHDKSIILENLDVSSTIKVN